MSYSGIYLSSIRGGIPCVPYMISVVVTMMHFINTKVLQQHNVGNSDKGLSPEAGVSLREH